MKKSYLIKGLKVNNRKYDVRAKNSNVWKKKHESQCWGLNHSDENCRNSMDERRVIGGSILTSDCFPWARHLNHHSPCVYMVCFLLPSFFLFYTKYDISEVF